MRRETEKEREYPDVKVGDSVRVQLKYTGGHKKGYMRTWSEYIYRDTDVNNQSGGTVYPKFKHKVKITELGIDVKYLQFNHSLP